MRESTTSYSIVIPGKPIPTPRPRVMKGYAYTPKRARDAQARIGQAWKSKYGNIQLQGAVLAEITLVFEPPKSWSKTKKKDALSGKFPATSHSVGDIDNLIKTATDGLNGIAYEDDSAITGIYAAKVYGDTAQTVITLHGGEK